MCYSVALLINEKAPKLSGGHNTQQMGAMPPRFSKTKRFPLFFSKPGCMPDIYNVYLSVCLSVSLKTSICLDKCLNLNIDIYSYTSACLDN